MGSDGPDGIPGPHYPTGGESVQRTRIGDTDWFKIERGVRQGCMISPGLYDILSEHIRRCALEEYHDGITIGGRRETNLRFVDDTTLLCKSKEELHGLGQKGQIGQQVPKPIASHERQISWWWIKPEKGKRTSF